MYSQSYSEIESEVLEKILSPKYRDINGNISGRKIRERLRKLKEPKRPKTVRLSKEERALADKMLDAVYKMFGGRNV